MADLGGAQGEREMLTGFLDWLREVAARKADGLTLDQATTVLTASGLTVLGVVHHLAWAERLWFPGRFAGADMGLATIDESFVLPADATVDGVVADYRAAADESRRVVDAAPALGEMAAQPHGIYGPVSLRWIIIHMIEETARHAGHLDVMRESIDGRTGD